MEVHHHVHPAESGAHTNRKKWTHYLWEFLMLFLAVFCGFLAEYQLEHKIEKDREKDYIVSLVEDLAADTSNLAYVIKRFDEKNLQLDTVLKMYQKLSIGYNDTLRRNLYAVQGFPDFIYADRTMSQLKNSGAMRLISNKAAANAIADYDSKVKDLIEIDAPDLGEVFMKVYQAWNEIIDEESVELDKKIMPAAAMEKGQKNYLLKDEKAVLGNFNNLIRQFLDNSRDVQAKEKDIKTQAIGLIILLKKTYRLE
jgi:hypothetical protein